jgi:hypothetical protein
MLTVKRQFGSYVFAEIAVIQPERDSAGRIIEDLFSLGDGVAGNKYAGGPFCRFRVGQSIPDAGVYALTVGDRLQYVGECENLAKRYSSTGYGRISPRNCHADGQSTNCKINSFILRQAKAGEAVTLWFHATEARKQVEAELIEALTPPWNGRRERARGEAAVAVKRVRAARPEPSRAAEGESRGSVRAEDFRRELEALFARAAVSGAERVRVRAGDLHRMIRAYSGSDHRMPVCCGVMRKVMTAGDVQIEGPPRGNGAGLTIEYRLPR